MIVSKYIHCSGYGHADWDIYPARPFDTADCTVIRGGVAYLLTFDPLLDARQRLDARRYFEAAVRVVAIRPYRLTEERIAS